MSQLPDHQNQTTTQNDYDEQGPELVRRRRPQTRKGLESRRVSLTAKLGAVALVITGASFGFWMLSSSHTQVSDEDLPEIIALNQEGDFKEAPSDEDAFQVPHEDKQLYAALEQKQGKTKQVDDKIVDSTPDSPIEPMDSLNTTDAHLGETIAIHETAPTNQTATPDVHINEATSSVEIKGDGLTTPPLKTETETTAHPTQAQPQQEQSKDQKQEPSAAQNTPSGQLEVVDRPSTPTEAEVAQAEPNAAPKTSNSPVVVVHREYKPLYQAIEETQKSIYKDASQLLKNKNLSKENTSAPTAPKTQKNTQTLELASAMPQKTPSASAKNNAVSSLNTLTPGTKSTPTSPTKKTTPEVKVATQKAAPQAATLKGSYCLQVGSMASQAQAQKEITRLKERCAQTLGAQNTYKIQRVDLGKKLGIRYRIYTGAFATKADAEMAKNNLKTQKVDALVVRG